jgi:hypothetical protein
MTLQQQLEAARTDQEIFQLLTGAVRRGEITDYNAQEIGECFGIDFADFPEVCEQCGAKESNWWKETDTGLLCSKCVPSPESFTWPEGVARYYGPINPTDAELKQWMNERY